MNTIVLASFVLLAVGFGVSAVMLWEANRTLGRASELLQQASDLRWYYVGYRVESHRSRAAEADDQGDGELYAWPTR